MTHICGRYSGQSGYAGQIGRGITKYGPCWVESMFSCKKLHTEKVFTAVEEYRVGGKPCRHELRGTRSPRWGRKFCMWKEGCESDVINMSFGETKG
jgi:hypothetical protein